VRLIGFENEASSSAETAGSGHHNAGYFPMANFVKRVIEDAPCPMDVYPAVEAAAPALIAGRSVDEGGRPPPVDDFRPGVHRRMGELPEPA